MSATGSSEAMVTAVGAAGAAVTLTLPAGGAGRFHYITSIELILYNTAARTGGATPVTVTTTNLPGTPAFTFPSAGAVGTIERRELEPSFPLRSAAANTATTIVCPATTSVIWRVNVVYTLYRPDGTGRGGAPRAVPPPGPSEDHRLPLPRHREGVRVRAGALPAHHHAAAELARAPRHRRPHRPLHGGGRGCAPRGLGTDPRARRRPSSPWT